MLKMDLEYEQEVLFIRFKGKLQRNVCYKINNYVVPVINKHHLKKLIINFKDVTYLDEAGVDALLNAKCAMKRNKGKLYLCEVRKEISYLLKRLHLKIVASEDLALKLLEV